MFGIGMVIAGGCASGTLMRVGEGFAMQMLSLLFFVIGSLIGASIWMVDRELYRNRSKNFPSGCIWMGGSSDFTVSNDWPALYSG